MLTAVSVIPSPYDLRRAFEDTFPSATSAPLQADADSQIIGPNGVAEMTGMSLSWVYHTFTVEVPPMKLGNKSRWYRRQVLAYLDSKAREAGARR